MAQTSVIATTTRKTKRFIDVLRVLASNGFETFVDNSKLIAAVEGGWSRLNHKIQPEHDPLPLAVRLRVVCEELGTTFVKLGQVLSTRPDLIPEEMANEFKKLQNDMPKVPFSEIESRLNEAYPDGHAKIFSAVDKQAVAAASIAQVHRATLVNGKPVVIKVVRPGVENVIKGDLDILRDLARLAERHFDHLGFRPTEVVEEFARHLEIELDLIHEARATERLSRYFEDDPTVAFPKVHWQATTKTILALEEIQGVQLSQLQPDQLTAVQRQIACKTTTRAVFRMCLEFGYFHADPHPGNLFFTKDQTMVFIDCGMTGMVETRTRYLLGEFVRGVIDSDLERTVRVALEITDADPSLSKDRRFRQEIWEMIGRCDTSTLDGLDFTALLSHFFEVLRHYQIHCPSDLVYLIKALMTIEGVVEEIDPQFDLVATARPLLTRLFAQHYGWSGIKERFLHNAGAYGELIENAPHEVRDMLQQWRRRNYAIELRHDGIRELRQAVVKTGQFVAMALILSAMLLSSAVLMHIEADQAEKGIFTTMGWITLSLCFFYSIMMAAGAWHRRDRS